jgi:hypothetical protein
VSKAAGRRARARGSFGRRGAALKGVGCEVPLARTPRNRRRRRSAGLQRSRAQSGRRLGPDGFRGGLGFGLVRAWVGLRPAKELREHH